MKIENLERLKARLQAISKRYGGDKNNSVVVGYKANYAIYVHEIPPTASLAKSKGSSRVATHKPGKQWKFLEQPARELRGELSQIIADALRKGAPLIMALTLAGQRLQEASMRLVPIDTGNLKSSAFTDTEQNLAEIMSAYDSESKR